MPPRFHLLALAALACGALLVGCPVDAGPIDGGPIGEPEPAPPDGGPSAPDATDAGAPGTDAGPSAVGRPNILLVIADDLGIDASTQYLLGRDPTAPNLPTTPNLDAMAQSGIVFDNVWATPACTTTRGTIITGEFGVHSGVDFVPAVLPTTATVLQAALADDLGSSAYASGIFGKWHLGGANPQSDHPQSFGIETYAGNLRGVLNTYTDWELTVDGVTAPETAYHTTKITDLALEWIAEQGEAPWFAWVAYSAPHSPFHLPPADLHTQTLSGTPADVDANKRAYYLAMIESLDSEVGRLVNALTPDVRDNTVVIFFGDNGTAAPVIDTAIFPRSHSKNSLYEGGVRVPMIIAGAGVNRSGERDESLINSVDLFPTIQALANSDDVGSLDGVSFADRLSNPNAPRRALNYVEFAGDTTTGWAVRDQRYKLIVFDGGAEELYDLDTDLREESNLIGDGNLVDITTRLRAFGLGVRGETPAGNVIDITNAIFAGRDASCTEYVENYGSHVTDIGRALAFEGSLSVTLSGDKCIFASNGIPNHDFNDGVVNGQNVQFPNAVSAQTQVFEMPQSPTFAGTNAPLLLSQDNGVLLNGVKVDLLAAGCFGVGNGRVGCNDIDQPWRFDPLFPASGFRVDSHNAHSQPNGAYHYHGPPNALFDEDGTAESGLIGFAADGFPIFGTYIDNDGVIDEVESSYRLRTDNNGARANGEENPGGNFDGTFRDDYVYVAGSGDLDECNGMTTSDGVYGYYVTNAFPWVMACYKGVPDPSFNK